jgi:hypothetical protein
MTCCSRGPIAPGYRCAIARKFAAQCSAAGPKVITLGTLRHSNISRMRPAGIAAWYGPIERMTQAVYGRVTDDRLTAAASAVSSPAIGHSWGIWQSTLIAGGALLRWRQIDRAQFGD